MCLCQSIILREKLKESEQTLIKLRKSRFQPAFVPTIGFLLFLPLLTFLGFWQIDRAEQKRALIEKQNARRNERPIRLPAKEINFEEYRYKPVIVQGKYDSEHQFLVDNRVVGGKAGFYVLAPFRISHRQRAVLVNRGWIPAGSDRSILPNVDIENPTATVTGIIDRFPGVGFRLKNAGVPAAGWPSIVQVVDPGKLSELLGYQIASFQLLLDKDAQDGFYRDWKIKLHVSPEKHRAYAFQWFALAATLTVLYLWYSTRLNE